MHIYLARNNQQAGPYTLEQLNQMLASQQILLTDLAWHQGMTEWKALGELTQGKLVYEPVMQTTTDIFSQQNIPSNRETAQTSSTAGRFSNRPAAESSELASINSRVLAKIIDLFLWFPAFAIPSFFFKPEQLEQLTALQKQMQSATSSEQAVQFQHQLIAMIPNEAFIMIGIYLFIMLALQAFLLARQGQSIGKKMLRIKIVDADTAGQVSLMRVFTIRTVLFIVLNLFLVPFITIADYAFGLGQKRQTLHDRLAKTKVIKQ